VDLQAQKADYFRTRTNNSWNILGGYATAAPGYLPKAAYHNNAYWTQYENYNNDSRQRYFGNISLNYKITDHLNLLGRVSKDSYNQLFETRIAVGSYQTPSYSKYLGTFSETNYDLLLNYDQDLGHGLNLKALLGAMFGKMSPLYLGRYERRTGGPSFLCPVQLGQNSQRPTEFYGRKEVDGILPGPRSVTKSC